MLNNRSLLRIVAAPVLILFLAVLVSFPMHALAQDDQQDQGFSQDQDNQGYQPDENFGAPPSGPGSQDYTENNQYVEETPATTAGALLATRQTQLRLSSERQQLPINAAWGAGTGLLIGGWFALINAGSARSTQQSVGTGVVLGVLIGIAVGARTVINPSLPQAAQNDTHPAGKPSTEPLVAMTADGLQLGVKFSF